MILILFIQTLALYKSFTYLLQRPSVDVDATAAAMTHSNI